MMTDDSDDWRLMIDSYFQDFDENVWDNEKTNLQMKHVEKHLHENHSSIPLPLLLPPVDQHQSWVCTINASA